MTICVMRRSTVVANSQTRNNCRFLPATSKIQARACLQRWWCWCPRWSWRQRRTQVWHIQPSHAYLLGHRCVGHLTMFASPSNANSFRTDMLGLKLEVPWVFSEQISAKFSGKRFLSFQSSSSQTYLEMIRPSPGKVMTFEPKSALCSVSTDSGCHITVNFVCGTSKSVGLWL